MIQTSRRTDVLVVDYIPAGRSEVFVDRIDPEPIGFHEAGIDLDFREQRAVADILTEYEDRKGHEVTCIWYTPNDDFGRYLYLNTRY